MAFPGDDDPGDFSGICLMSDQYTFEDRGEVIRLKAAWDEVRRSLELELQRSSFDKFIRPITVQDFAMGRVLMVVPGQFAAEWVKSRFLKRLQTMLGDELGEPITIDLRVGSRAKDAVDIPSVALVQHTVSVDSNEFRPNPKYRFDTFVVGQSNRMAVAGASAISHDPGVRYNPLFIYGAPGLGKTHLMHSIANEILAARPKTLVRYITAQQFVEQFVQAFQSNRIEQFRRLQREVDVWLVDDIQFVAGKDKTQEEIFHTFNHLYDMSRQIVLCADRPPRDLYTMDERLRSRFESGLVVDIQPPDTETRAAIILSKACQENLEIEPEIALFLAERVHGNIRHLVGALTKLAVMASLASTPITIALAEQCVEKYYSHARNEKPGMPQIVGVVSKYYKIPADEIVGDSRKAPIAHARHVAVFIAREVTQDSWKHLGSLFGDRDHTSMMHAYQKISELMSRDRDLDTAIKSMIRDLKPSGSY